MSTRPAHRKLTEHLREWDAERIAELLRRRPDLATPAPSDVAELAQRAQHQPSVAAAIARAMLPENRLLQVVVCLRPSVPDAELVRALPDGVAWADVEPVLASLEAAALVWRHAGRVHCSGTLRQCMPTTLGPPLHHFERALTVEHLRHAIGLLRPLLDDARQVGPLPPVTEGTAGRPPRKADLMEELSTLLSQAGVAAAVSDAAPDGAADLLELLAEGPAWVRVGHSLWFSSHSTSSYYSQQPTYWLFERGLLLPEGDGVATLPRELALSWRGGRPVTDLALVEPVLVDRPVDATEVDKEGAIQVGRLLDHAAELLDGWRAEPAKALKSGGLGVTVLRALASRLEVAVADVSRLVELLHLAGLLEETTSTHRVKRTVSYETTVGPAPVAAGWLAQPMPVRWRQLAGAWQRAQRWTSLAGAKEAGVKPLPALGPQYQEATEAASLRAVVLDALAAQAPGTAVDADALAASLYWHAPQAWLRGSPGPPEEAIGWILGEAEALGVNAGGALTSFGRALWGGDPDAAEAALAGALPAPATSFMLQADLTAVVVGRLAREVALELRLLADVESTGAATTFRFSEASLRRGLDAGRAAASINAFLRAHAARGVPKALAYLVVDVERRHGHLQVGTVKAFVTSDDPAVLADAVSHRRTRKLGLRLLAPTVAVSPEPAAKVLSTLREVGFLPVAEGEAPATITLPGDDGRPPIADRGGDAIVDLTDGAEAEHLPGDLPEPFRWRGSPARRGTVGRANVRELFPRPQGPTVPEPVDADEAARIAEAILASGADRRGARFR